MATSRICSIPDCGKRHFGRGWCNQHYSRWRYNGDPLALAVKKPTEIQTFFRKVVLTHDEEACLLWPYARINSGYPNMLHEGRTQLVHRVVCEIAHGAPPTAMHQAAHGCGNKTCVNSRHLRWATQIENEVDKLNHGRLRRGERCYQSGLTDDSAREILNLKNSGLQQKEIGALYGVSADVVHQIHSRKTWAWLD